LSTLTGPEKGRAAAGLRRPAPDPGQEGAGGRAGVKCLLFFSKTKNAFSGFSPPVVSWLPEGARGG
jgi:hypothetical protein